jgi:heme-degrading monooxygenase HmoA
VYVALDHVGVARSDLDTYAKAWQDHVVPALSEQPGYQGCLLLRPRDKGDVLRLAQLEWWGGRDDHRHWTSSSAHQRVEAGAASLVRDRKQSLWEGTDASVVVADPGTASMCSIAFHHAIAGGGVDYLACRRKVANPSMSKAPGFVGVDVCSDPDERDRFMVVFSWADDAAADDYYATPEHTGVVTKAVGGALRHDPVPSPRHDVLLRDVPQR